MGSKKEKRNKQEPTEKAGNGQGQDTDVTKTSPAGNGKPIAGSDPASLGRGMDLTPIRKR